MITTKATEYCLQITAYSLLNNHSDPNGGSVQEQGYISKGQPTQELAKSPQAFGALEANR